MGRKKQVRPHRSVGIHGKQIPGAELRDNNNARAEKDNLVDVDEPFFVEVDRSTLSSDEHMDISEIVLSDLSIEDGYRFSDELYEDSRYLLRLKLNGANPHLSRIKLGHWPVLPSASIVVELVTKHMNEDGEEHLVMVSGNLDGPDEGVSGLAHLASLKFLTLRPAIPITFSEGLSSVRIRVEILRTVFDACESLLDNSRQLWKKSMISIMAWLRPEVTTSDARYGCSIKGDIDTDLGADENTSASRKHARFDVASFYEAIKPSKDEPVFDVHLPNLVPELRPYQRRAVYWMVQREKGTYEPSKINSSISPLCMPLSLIEKSAALYYNPFSGNMSLHPDSSFRYISGGILADEMGLGKTVELLACVFAHQVTSTSIGSLSNSTQVHGDLRKDLKRLKRERVECICGSVSESFRYKGLWVQCDVCDAWQHADCVGYSPQKRKKSMKGSKQEMNRNDSSGKLQNRAKRKGNTEIVEMDGVYICRACTELIQATEAPVASGATLIVCPTPILPQWHAEIIRHSKPGSLRTCIYEGVRTSTFSETPLMDINELLSSDIVLTTYDVLKEDLSHDSDRHDGDRRLLRFEKRYPVIPTPLTRILWWRICLDEAQMVESNAAAATEMALRLHTVHRWCITGTPIQRRLDDLYGLLKFLKASPFDVFRWWTDVICDPYERGDEGAMTFTHNFFKLLMWRSSKEHVAEELQLPPQEECISWISLSPIEKHFYQRQHETCVNEAHVLIEDLKDNIQKKKPQETELSDSLSGVVITNMEAAKLFNSLLKLRQACCHPQVGSSGLRSLQQSPMTMEEILSVLVGKTKVEGEEELRKLVVALNALAGIAIIEKDTSQAISLYKEALSLAEEHSEDFRLDPLLNIHICHNLAEILLTNSDGLEKLPSAPGSFIESSFMTEGVEDGIQNSLKSERKGMEVSNLAIKGSSNSLVDLLGNYSGHKSSDAEPERQHLKASCESLKQRYLSVFNSKLYMAQQEFRKSYEQVCNAFNDRKNQHTTWWLESLHHIEQNKDFSIEFIRKIGEAVSGTLNTSRASRVASCFRSITALKYFIQTGLDLLEDSRRTLLDRLLEIDQTMDNPRKEDIDRVRYCPKCYANCEGPMCVHCELDDLFQAYEASLFRLNKGKYGETITSAEEAVNLQKKMSALNRFYSTLSQSNKKPSLSTLEAEDNGNKRDTGERVLVSKSPSDLEVVLGIIKSNSRGLLDREGMSAATKQLLLLEGMRKEYPQARSLAIAQAQVLRAYDEINMATSRLRLREDENDKSIDALDLGELVTANAEFSSEKFLALSSLSRVKGQLRYLKGLVQSKQNQPVESTNDKSSTQATVSSRTCEEKHNGSCMKIEEDACPICHEKLHSQKMVFQCGHVICCKCLFALTEQRLGHLGKPLTNWVMCPTCRRHTDYRNIAYAVDGHNKSDETPFDTSESPEASISVHGSYSTKVEAVTRRILWIKSRNPIAKVLVFSSWNDVLDVLEHAFTANGITHIRMKGGRKAQASINCFRGQNINLIGGCRGHDMPPDTKTVQVLLLLIQHGANGLNLLEAEHVILVEPLLNPAAEAQAVSRVHRIGQTKKTLVHRFIVKDTVEESIHKLNKSRAADSFVSGNRKNQDHPVLTLKDVESLFRVVQPTDQNPPGSLMHLPPSVAAAIAAEKRLAGGATLS